MAAPESPSIPAYQKLKALRPLLLKFHKALLEAERDRYERIHGPIASKGEFFQLVIGDDWFGWLRPISKFIVQMDEVLWAKEPVSPKQIYDLLNEARSLVPPSGEQSDGASRYGQAIQQNVELAGMHNAVATLLGNTPFEGEP
ncbi:MAG: hypothetical protein O3A14_18160 [Cyanobacteria bacterium]|nr:hypothetical protein [Cyanobacteriota bacterium]